MEEQYLIAVIDEDGIVGYVSKREAGTVYIKSARQYGYREAVRTAQRLNDFVGPEGLFHYKPIKMNEEYRRINYENVSN